jgi:hypothetical protein
MNSRFRKIVPTGAATQRMRSNLSGATGSPARCRARSPRPAPRPPRPAGTPGPCECGARCARGAVSAATRGAIKAGRSTPSRVAIPRLVQGPPPRAEPAMSRRSSCSRCWPCWWRATRLRGFSRALARVGRYASRPQVQRSDGVDFVPIRLLSVRPAPRVIAAAGIAGPIRPPSFTGCPASPGSRWAPGHRRGARRLHAGASVRHGAPGGRDLPEEVDPRRPGRALAFSSGWRCRS